MREISVCAAQAFCSPGWPETHPWQLAYKGDTSFTGLYQRNDQPHTTTSLSKPPPVPGRNILLPFLSLWGHITESNFRDLFWQAKLENPTHSATVSYRLQPTQRIVEDITPGWHSPRKTTAKGLSQLENSFSFTFHSSKTLATVM